ncbi:MAG: DUF423 domain-containing protein [Opitutales bacterium]|nr:DUF423 domain-containing protein [Opitutales bacterium]
MSEPRNHRGQWILAAAAAFGAAGVALGAFGAHALGDTLAERGYTAVWETAVLYHLAHAVAALTAASGTGGAVPARAARAAALLWIVGILLFSGSLYAIALGGPRWLGPVTPLGGAAFIGGWLTLAVGASLRRRWSA